MKNILYFSVIYIVLEKIGILTVASDTPYPYNVYKE